MSGNIAQKNYMLLQLISQFQKRFTENAPTEYFTDIAGIYPLFLF